MRLTDEQRTIVAENMGLVGRVIKDKVHGIDQVGLFTRDDLYQYGCIGLCKAAATYKPGKARFSTYAYRLIHNEILDALAYASVRRKRESVDCPGDLASCDGGAYAYTYTADINGLGVHDELTSTLDAAQGAASGVTAKGIQAIRLLAQGYTSREIGERMGGANANNVTAWVARARKYLRAVPEIAALRE